MRPRDRYYRLAITGGAKATEVRAEFVDVTDEVERRFALTDEIKAACGRHDQAVRDAVSDCDTTRNEEQG